MTPAVFSGGWQRDGLRINSGPANEPGRVVWLQVGDAYVDIRTPVAAGLLSGPGAFAGTTTFADDHLTWRHQIDCPAPPPAEAATEDIGRIRWRDGVLLETGSFTIDDQTTRYEEHWTRLDGSADGPAYSLSPATPADGDGLGVRTGDHLVAVQAGGPDAPEPWAAIHLHHFSGRWNVVTQLGDAALALELEQAITCAVENSPSLETTSSPMKWKVNAAHTLPS